MNDLSPMLVLVAGTITSSDDAERSRLRDKLLESRLIFSVRYIGAKLWMHLKTSRHILNSILSDTGSQWRSINSGVMCSRLVDPLINLAAALTTSCSVQLKICC